MAENKQEHKPEKVPSFASIEEASEWWDEHSVGDYWDEAKETHFDIQIDKKPLSVILDSDVAGEISDIATKQGVSSEVLVNSWLRKMLEEQVME
jgi:hypothetical protein